MVTENDCKILVTAQFTVELRECSVSCGQQQQTKLFSGPCLAADPYTKMKTLILNYLPANPSRTTSVTWSAWKVILSHSWALFPAFWGFPAALSHLCKH